MALVEVAHRAGSADLLGLDQRLPLRLQERQPEILEQQRRQLVDRDLGLVVVDAGDVAGLLPLAGALALAARLLPEDVAHLGVALALAGVVLSTAIEAEARQLQRAD